MYLFWKITERVQISKSSYDLVRIRSMSESKFYTSGVGGENGGRAYRLSLLRSLRLGDPVCWQTLTEPHL